jgi:NAD(P)-dependent dehydrogenase (short-subunit alcohol dehydrogenase family)
VTRMSELFDLTGNVAPATGANTGLAFLQGCAKQRADVVVRGRWTDRNAEAVAKLKALEASRVRADAVDVSDEAAVVDAFAVTQRVMGRVDRVLANAAQAGDPRGRQPA